MSGEYDPDFIQRNGVWLLTLMGLLAACLGGVLTCVLKSRCRTINACGMRCDRDVVKMTAQAANVQIQPPDHAV